jgi:hypothetical protein
VRRLPKRVILASVTHGSSTTSSCRRCQGVLQCALTYGCLETTMRYTVC